MKISKNKIFVIIFFALAATSIFLINFYQRNKISELSAVFKNKEQTEEKKSEAEQIAELRKEIEELKAQSAAKEKSSLQPAKIPQSDFKTAEELAQARAQIDSLSQQLSQLKSQKDQTAPTPSSDADLLKTWNAEEKVVRVACLDKFMNSWQMGSGVLISDDGKVLTNQHVVQASFSLTLPEYCLILFNKDYDTQKQSYKKQYRANISGFFEDRDAALLKINDVMYLEANGSWQTVSVVNKFPFFRPALSAPQIGETVYVIGFPESANFSFSVTKGIISNLNTDGVYFGTDAQIDRGNSGGAALNSSGQLVGLPTYKFVSSGDYRGYILNIQTIQLN